MKSEALQTAFTDHDAAQAALTSAQFALQAAQGAIASALALEDEGNGINRAHYVTPGNPTMVDFNWDGDYAPGSILEVRSANPGNAPQQWTEIPQNIVAPGAGVVRATHVVQNPEGQRFVYRLTGYSPEPLLFEIAL